MKKIPVAIKIKERFFPLPLIFYNRSIIVDRGKLFLVRHSSFKIL